RAFILLRVGVDALGNVSGLAVQIAGVLRFLPVKALLLVADVFYRRAHHRLQTGDDLFREGLVLRLRRARAAGSHFTSKHDAVCGDERFARDPGFGVHRDEGVHNGIGDAVRDLVRMALGHAFAREYVIASSHADSPTWEISGFS